VVIELMDHRFGVVDRLPPTMRAVSWHDWTHTGMACRQVLELPLPAVEKLQLLAMHANSFLERTANPGGGSEWLHERFFPSRKALDTKQTERAGFKPAAKGNWTESARADFAKKIAAFVESPPQRLRPGFAAALREIIGEVRRVGAEPVFVLPPTVRTEEKLTEGWPEDTIVLAFDDPVKYARLYLPELHYDVAHLDEEGAREFTTLLAQRLADLKQKP
jgi:hypothetical protein